MGAGSPKETAKETTTEGPPPQPALSGPVATMIPSPSSPSFRPTYTHEQLAAYLACLTPDPTYTLATLEAEIKRDPLAALGRLQLLQVAFNPWGNVALHYSWHHTLSLDSEALFHKIVERKLGGYCMENNAFFSTVLRSLGIQLYVTGARISHSMDGNGKDPGGFAGWSVPTIYSVRHCGTVL